MSTTYQILIVATAKEVGEEIFAKVCPDSSLSMGGKRRGERSILAIEISLHLNADFHITISNHEKCSERGIAPCEVIDNFRTVGLKVAWN